MKRRSSADGWCRKCKFVAVDKSQKINKCDEYSVKDLIYNKLNFRKKNYE